MEATFERRRGSKASRLWQPQEQVGGHPPLQSASVKKIPREDSQTLSKTMMQAKEGAHLLRSRAPEFLPAERCTVG